VPLVLALVAECCSWVNLTTRCDLFSVIEQSLWALLFWMVGLGSALLWRTWHRHAPAEAARRGMPALFFGALAVIMGSEQAYEALGLYLPRFRDEGWCRGGNYTDVAVGLESLASCATVSQDLSVWAGDLAWMSGYFTVGVWSSLWLAVTRAWPLAPEQPASALLAGAA
jgi:hypothetical protein